MEIFTNLAETDNLPWAVQTVLLNIIETTGVQAGAIRLNEAEDYIFAVPENITDFEKNTALGCRFSGEHSLFTPLSRDIILPCMFRGELVQAGSFFCTNISRWYEMNAGLAALDGKPCCEKCKELGYETVVMVPIKTAGEVLGLIHLYDSRKKAVSAEEVTFLETISSTLGYALKHLQDRECIRKSEEQFRFLAENAKDIIFRMQILPERKFIYVSPASVFISGYAPVEYYAHKNFDKKLVYPADYHKYKSSISSRADYSKPLTLRLVRKDGRIIWVELHCVPIYNKNRVEIIEGIARDITERVQAEEKLKSSYEQLQVFSSLILKAQEKEKIRLSRELHDEVGQALTAVKIDLQVIKEELRKKGFGFQERLAESVRLVDATLERVRKQAVSLRPPALDHMGLVAAVQSMAQGFSRRTGIKTKIIAENKTSRFPNEIETALFRCVQESLTNVARHSQAEKVIIEFQFLPDSIRVCVEDNGRGFKKDVSGLPPQGIGITGMQERVRLLNGVFKIDTPPQGGTRVMITVPFSCKKNAGRQF